LEDPLAQTIPDPDATGEERFITMSMDPNGQLLVVVHALAVDIRRWGELSDPH
jgi:uncharacterized DUF497 family protein